MKNQLQNLMNTEFSRKEFLGMAGLVVGSLLGFSTILKLLTGKSLADHTKHSSSSDGYGK